MRLDASVLWPHQPSACISSRPALPLLLAANHAVPAAALPPALTTRRQLHLQLHPGCLLVHAHRCRDIGCTANIAISERTLTGAHLQLWNVHKLEADQVSCPEILLLHSQQGQVTDLAFAEHLGAPFFGVARAPHVDGGLVRDLAAGQPCQSGGQMHRPRK